MSSKSDYTALNGPSASGGAAQGPNEAIRASASGDARASRGSRHGSRCERPVVHRQVEGDRGEAQADRNRPHEVVARRRIEDRAREPGAAEAAQLVAEED